MKISLNLIHIYIRLTLYKSVFMIHFTLIRYNMVLRDQVFLLYSSFRIPHLINRYRTFMTKC